MVRGYIVKHAFRLIDRYGYDCMAIFLFFMIGVEVL